MVLNSTIYLLFFYILDDIDSPSSYRSQSHSNSFNQSLKSNSIHPTILSGDVTPSCFAVPPTSLIIPSTLNESKDNDLLTTTDINDDGNTSDSSTNDNHEIICDDGPVPLTCEKGKFIYIQGFVFSSF